jgi:hypothetical protein
MDIQEGDFKKENIVKSIKKIENIAKELMRKIINDFDGEQANNILKGTLCKFISRLNIYLINLNLLKEFINETDKIFKFANKFTYIEKEISRDYFVTSRFDFFVGIFSLFEDAISNELAMHMLSKEELEKMEVSPEYEKILKNNTIKEAIKTNLPKLFNKLTEPTNFVPFDSIIRKFRKEKIISETQESFLLGCKIIRNSLHNNGYHQSKSIPKLEMLGEAFSISEKMPLNFMALERIIKWANEIIIIFIEIALKTDWRNITDRTI